ncbi:hypothetical protein CesoFtcFv8_021402 [Champsocephalus esox]|uniref:Uncharacterized protein n=1 Tax=Champsocephalus esox TaxID=159716 RepID=A0AAN8BCU5_9TELE|nr:hypothetical protein CesoFtcFv8_021402 [Champsocephalus esox]
MSETQRINIITAPVGRQHEYVSSNLGLEPEDHTVMISGRSERWRQNERTDGWMDKRGDVTESCHTLILL